MKQNNEKNNMVIGMVGGVGSGKSTVLERLATYPGVHICMTDILGHEAMEPGRETFYQILDLFEKRVLNTDGTINRAKIAEIVYQEPQKLEQLDGIIHPYVKRRIEEEIQKCKDNEILFLESAILYESGCDAYCQQVWGILTEDAIRVQRLMENRGYSEEKARGIMRQQLSNEELEHRCQVILKNNGGREELFCQIDECMENLLEK